MWSCWQHWHYVDNMETHLYGTLKHIHNLKRASCWRSCWWLWDPHPRSCKFIHNSSLWEIGYYLESMSFRTLASNLNSMPKLNTYECHLVVVDLLVDKIEYCVNHKQHRGPHEPRTRFSNVMDFFFYSNLQHDVWNFLHMYVSFECKHIWGKVTAGGR